MMRPAADDAGRRTAASPASVSSGSGDTNAVGGPPPRIAFYASSALPNVGGVEQVVHNLAREHERVGGSALVVAPTWPPELPPHSLIDGVRIERLSMPLPNSTDWTLMAAMASALSKHIRLMRSYGPDLIHVHCVAGNALYGWLTARALRLPLMVTLHGEMTMDETGLYQQSRTIRALLRMLLKRADTVTAVSQYVLTTVRERYDVTAPSQVILNGVSLQGAELGDAVLTSRPTILGFGRHEWKKGFDVLIGAFAQSRASSTHDLVIGGCGSQTTHLRDLAERLDIADAVHFPGQLDRQQVSEALRGADLFVLPSREEPLGIVALEAMAAGTPIVASHVGGVPELLRHGVTGWLVPPDDVRRLGETIDHALDCEVRRRRVADAASHEVERHRWADRYLDYRRSYDRLAAAHVRPRHRAMAGVDR